MNVAAWVWASVFATAALTITMVGSQRMGWTRMSLPLMLGTALTADRDRALVVGTFLHFASGFTLAAIYCAFFEWWGQANWWIGAICGALHGALVLLVFFPVLPGIHPRMATENHGPEPTRGLEPPGPLGSNYGYPTAVFTFAGHLAYGTVLGALYRLAGGA